VSDRIRAIACLPMALLGLVASCSRPPGVEPGRRVLLVTVDTLRADHVGVYGGPVPTPAIDAIAYAGVTVADAFTPTPSTLPAHASLLTGLHPWRHGVLDNAVPLPAGVPTVAERAQAAGLATAAFVSSYILHERFGLARGFAEYRFEPGEAYVWRGRRHDAFWTLGAITTGAALAWLRERAHEPFFLWVHYFDPHHPYEPPPGYERPRSEPAPVTGKQLPDELETFDALATALRGYRGEVAYADAQVGRLVDGLRALGILDATAVVLTADHGEGLGDHGELQHGRTLFEELVRVPLVIRAPGLPAGARVDGPVQLEDLAPTLLELLGLEVPGGLDGRSLLPWLRGEAPAPRETVLGRRKPYPGEPDLFFVRRAATKWIGDADGEGLGYRLEADPREQQGAPLPAPAELGPALRGGEPAPPLLDAESRRALEALGYLEPDPAAD
jgi:arylsulfatase A-like enzyme